MATKMVVATVSYTAPVVLPLTQEGEPDPERLYKPLLAFGASDIHVVLSPYTGAGEHEFVASKDPGIAVSRCVKCFAKQGSKKGEAACPGVQDDD